MKKARTLLAIWLALILTLTLFPTALATGDDGGSATPNPLTTDKQVDWNVDNNVTITSNKPGSVPVDQNFAFSFKATDGYEIDSVEFKIGNQIIRNNLDDLTPADGVYTYSFSAQSLAASEGNVSITITAKALSQSDPNPQATYTVRYTGEGADVSEEIPVNAGDSINLKSVNRSGYILKGWREIGGKETILPPGDSYKPTGDVTLQAVWAVTVTYAGEGAGVSGSPEVVVVGEAMNLKNVSRPGYTLKGWKVGNTEEILAVGSEYKPTKSITLTAVWGQDVTVTYSEGEPAAAGNSQKLEVGDIITVAEPDSNKIPAGKIFTGWKASDGKTYQPGDKITLTETNLTLTAQYDDKVIVKFAKENNSGNVSGMPSDTEAPYNQSYKLPTKEPSRTDGSYEFGRWRLNFNGNTYTYSAGATINWASIGVDAGDTVTFIADFDHHYYADYDEDDDKPSKPSKPTYDEYRIRATCSDGGWVSPAGSSYVREGRNLTVTFAPWNGYAIDGVYIDGVLDNRFDGSYTFRDVDENHTIYVRYVRDSGSSGGSSGGGSHWDDDTSPKTGDASAPLSMGLGVGSLALIAFLVARKMRRA